MLSLMAAPDRRVVDDWTVDYGKGESPCRVPHVWGQEFDIRSEGPVVYRVDLPLPREPASLLFHGVSYQCLVRVDGRQAAERRGIWDAFVVDLSEFAGRSVRIEVEVRKNGGPSFPVRESASGFLPFVHGTFGGIFRDVELVLNSDDVILETGPPTTRVSVEGGRILVDSRPFFMRGVLHWGWYPEVGSPNPDEATIRDEVRKLARLGFNCIKFCLWLPPHDYLRILDEAGLFAWIELPLWDPAPIERAQQAIFDELQRIVRQYRRHSNVVAWTAGCELGATVDADARRGLYRMIAELTGCPLVRDSSGGAEMYGGDLREFADFEDFHPYFELPELQFLLDQFHRSARPPRPILLGETADCDVHRDLSALRRTMPFWASTDPSINDQGSRWQHDLPPAVESSKFSSDEDASGRLLASSESKAAFVRKHSVEAFRAHGDLAGYVLTGIRDTPVSTSGIFRDDGSSRVELEEARTWNGDNCLFMIPVRRPSWVNGGNRAGYRDPFCHFAGDLFIRIGAAFLGATTSSLEWRLSHAKGDIVSEGAESPAAVLAARPSEVAQLRIADVPCGDYTLRCSFQNASNEWPITVLPRARQDSLKGWGCVDPEGRFGDLKLDGSVHWLAGRMTASVEQAWQEGANVLFFAKDEFTIPSPFWREAGYEFDGIDPLPWHRYWSITPDRAFERDLPWPNCKTLMNRVDLRNYRENPVIVRAKSCRGGTLVATTLRPEGGVGTCSPGVTQNPSGLELILELIGAIE